MGGEVGGIHTNVGSPTNPSAHRQDLMAVSQNAFKPQLLAPHDSTHVPDSQIWFSLGQGSVAEQPVAKHLPPGYGLPNILSKQTQVGPLGDTMHCAFRPQMTP